MMWCLLQAMYRYLFWEDEKVSSLLIFTVTRTDCYLMKLTFVVMATIK